MERENALPELARLAEGQWGLVTRAQLHDFGLRERGIADWVRAGRIRRLYRGVYAFGHDRLRREGHWLAAVLACGPGAVLSHHSAAALWDLRAGGATRIDVTVPSQNGRVTRAGIRIHRSGRLPPGEVTVRHGIPVTTVARTILDEADILDMQGLRRMVTEAEYTQRFDLSALTAVVENNPGRRTRKVLQAAGARMHRTRSPLEDRFLRFVERHGIEEPETNVWLEGWEVDCFWRGSNLAVELDGLSAHATRAAVRRDRQKDRALWRVGVRTMRLTAEDLNEADAVLGDLVQAGVSVANWPRASSKSPRRAKISSAKAR